MPDELSSYSVDASALIEAKMAYPMDVFGSFWDFLGRLGDEGRLHIPGRIKAECLDGVFKPWFKKHGTAVAPFDEYFEPYFRTLTSDMSAKGLHLIDPGSNQNEGDPHVIALALMVEQRAIENLRTPGANRCVVVTYEKLKGPGGRLTKIPNVCREYNLVWMQWPELLRLEGWHL